MQMIELSESFTEFELSPTLRADELAAAKRAEGLEICHMGFGQSPFPVARRLEEALCNSAGRKEYLPTGGLGELRDAVKEYYSRHTGLDMNDYEILVAPGSKLILYTLQMAVRGDLILPVPSWVSYVPQARMIGDKVLKVPARLDDHGYHIDQELLRSTIRNARAEGSNPGKIIINSPNNPTGLKITSGNLKEITRVCLDEGILIISDEIYDLVSFDEGYVSSALYAPELTVISTGLSKHLSLGGWRIGIGIVPKAIPGLYARMRQIASELWSCVPTPIQQASVEAYRGHEDIESFIKDCTAIHRLMTTHIAKSLKEAGIISPVSQGAFYIYPDFEPFRENLSNLGITTSTALADHLINKYGLVALPGIAFGEEPEKLTLRLSSSDYDGKKALDAYRGGEALDSGFISRHAPRTTRAVEILSNFAGRSLTA
jgi:aspartate/methionine/tyrosine aminotransferase